MKQSFLTGLITLFTLGCIQAQDWSKITPDSGDVPLARTNSTAVYDSLLNRMIILGEERHPAI